MVNPAWIIRAAAVVFADEDARRKLGWIVAAICSPLILTLALICSLLSGSAEHKMCIRDRHWIQRIGCSNPQGQPRRELYAVCFMP